MLQMIKTNIPCDPSMMDHPETCWKPLKTGHGVFWQVSEFLISIIFIYIYFFFSNKELGILLETCAADFQKFSEVSGGFQMIYHGQTTWYLDMKNSLSQRNQ